MGVLKQLKQLGVRVALDDFGTGYSSLSYLRRLPVDMVKIDRSFITDIHEPKTRAIVAAVVNVAHVLGLGVTAEGIETPSQHEAIRAIGCDLAQGYHFAEPLTASTISSILRSSEQPGCGRTAGATLSGSVFHSAQYESQWHGNGTRTPSHFDDDQNTRP